MLNLPELPCIDCITAPICKSILIESFTTYSLFNRCIFMKNFYRDTDGHKNIPATSKDTMVYDYFKIDRW